MAGVRKIGPESAVSKAELATLAEGVAAFRRVEPLLEAVATLGKVLAFAKRAQELAEQAEQRRQASEAAAQTASAAADTARTSLRELEQKLEAARQAVVTLQTTHEQAISEHGQALAAAATTHKEQLSAEARTHGDTVRALREEEAQLRTAIQAARRELTTLETDMRTRLHRVFGAA